MLEIAQKTDAINARYRPLYHQVDSTLRHVEDITELLRTLVFELTLVVCDALMTGPVERAERLAYPEC